MRYAVIDVGTNTVKLLVADSIEKDLKTLLEDSVTTRLGQSVAQNHRLLPEAIERTLETVRDFVARARELQPRHFLAYATSAVRDSSNRDEFLRRFREVAGFDCQVISGEEEAELIFLGATSQPAMRNRNVIVFDIGGGSIEFIRGGQVEIEFKTSLDCGAVRMTETFLRADPPTDGELGRLEEFIGRQIRAGLARDPNRASHLMLPILGTGGTINNLASMELECERWDAARIDGRRLSIDRLRALARQLGAMPLERRKQLRGLNPSRADIIVAGAMILVSGVEALGQKEITVSIRNLRHGAVVKQGGCS